MGATASRGAADAVRGLFEAGTAVGATDGELLERFAGRRDEGAFAALVERHGPMVLRACRSALGDEHAALDAFQATFLVLARKGGSLRSRNALGPWLHRVALRASGRERRALARRRAAERRAAEVAGRPAATAAEPAPERDETAAVVHDEVDRLPGRYREAVVLCDLEGMTCEQAARRLGRPTGTVASRLARGRERLRERLRRRGLDPRAAVAAGPSAPLPNHLAESTASAALRFLAPATGPTWAAAALATGVLRAMTRTALCHAAAALLALGASTTGVVALAARGGAPALSQEPAPPPPAEAKPDEKAGAAEVATVGARPIPLTYSLRSASEMRFEGGGAKIPLKAPNAGTRVESILPTGTKVSRGDVVARIRPADSERRQQQPKAQATTADRGGTTSRLAREAAELALKEYEEATYPSERAALAAAVRQAEAELIVAGTRKERLKRARERFSTMLKGRGEAAAPADVLAGLEVEDRADAAAIALDRARATLEHAQSKLDSLERFTRPRKLKQLAAELEKARPNGRASQPADDEVVSFGCATETDVIRSPIDGIVEIVKGPRPQVEADPGEDGPETTGGENLPNVLAEDRTIAYVRPSSEWAYFEVLVGQALAARLREGQPTLIRVLDTEDNPVRFREHAGEISGIGASWGENEAVHVWVGWRKPPLGMPLDPVVFAVVELASPEGAIAVPRSSLVWYDGVHHVGVRGADGAVSWREVAPGLYDRETVEIRSGLEAGASVVIDPVPILSEDQRRRVTIAGPPPEPALAKPQQ